MTFKRLLPVFRKLQILPWISLSVGMLGILVFALMSLSASQPSPAQEKNCCAGNTPSSFKKITRIFKTTLMICRET
jgi:hypothetical protein